MKKADAGIGNFGLDGHMTARRREFYAVHKKSHAKEPQANKSGMNRSWMQATATKEFSPANWNSRVQPNGKATRQHETDIMIGAILSSDPIVFTRIESCFESDHFNWRVFESEDALLYAMRNTTFDVIFIDAALAGVSGKPIMNWRDCHAACRTVVVMLTSFAQLDVLARSIEACPDELVASPLNFNELHARTWRAIKRRRGTGNPTQGYLNAGAYRLHHGTSRIWLNETLMNLTSREFALAWMLFSNVGVRLSRELIAAAVWGTSSQVVERTLEQHIYKLRKKLRLSPETGVRLRTLYSMGYKLEAWNDTIQPPAEIVARPQNKARLRSAVGST